MNLCTKRNLGIVFFGGGIVLLILGSLLGFIAKLIILGFSLLIFGAIWLAVKYRCPKCGAYIKKLFKPTNCTRCGRKIDLYSTKVFHKGDDPNKPDDDEMSFIKYF